MLEIQALEARIWALQAFDKQYGAGARVLERLFLVLGLPTLATAVRPHLKVAGRVGRPSKVPPADDYPDLVEQVRAAGLLPEGTAETAAAAARPRERRRLAAWMAAYRQVVVPYLSFLARWSASRPGPEGSESPGEAIGRRSAAAWPARALARRRRSDAG